MYSMLSLQETTLSRNNTHISPLKKLQALEKLVYLVIICEHPDKVGWDLYSGRLSELDSESHKQTIDLISKYIWQH